jgi:hypothetical protein
MYSLDLLMMDGKDRPKHVECHPKIKQIDTLVHLVGITIEINSDARPYERQIYLYIS